jgi:hypothetical protein
MQRIRVLFPDPELPINVTISPCAALILTSFRTSRGPKDLRRFRTSSRGFLGVEVPEFT